MQTHVKLRGKYKHQVQKCHWLNGGMRSTIYSRIILIHGRWIRHIEMTRVCSIDCKRKIDSIKQDMRGRLTWCSFLFILVTCPSRFHCPKCSHNWTSAIAKVDLYYPKSRKSLSQVTLRFYGQECRRCSQKAVYYVDPNFNVDDIQIMLEKLHERVGWSCYGKKRTEKKVIGTSNRDRVMNGPHEKHLCEACKMGRCDQV